MSTPSKDFTDAQLASLNALASIVAQGIKGDGTAAPDPKNARALTDEEQEVIACIKEIHEALRWTDRRKQQNFVMLCKRKWENWKVMLEYQLPKPEYEACTARFMMEVGKLSRLSTQPQYKWCVSEKNEAGEGMESIDNKTFNSVEEANAHMAELQKTLPLTKMIVTRCQ